MDIPYLLLWPLSVLGAIATQDICRIPGTIYRIPETIFRIPGTITALYWYWSFGIICTQPTKTNNHIMMDMTWHYMSWLDSWQDSWHKNSNKLHTFSCSRHTVKLATFPRTRNAVCFYILFACLSGTGGGLLRLGLRFGAGFPFWNCCCWWWWWWGLSLGAVAFAPAKFESPRFLLADPEVNCFFLAWYFSMAQ